MTFVHATFVFATYVHIRNISAVTDQILMKFWDPKFFGPKFFFGTYLSSLVKIESVTAEIFLIWTNIAKTGQISPLWLESVKDGSRNLPFKH